MTTTPAEEAPKMPFAERQTSALLASAREVSAQRGRARDLMCGASDQLGDVISLGPATGDDFICEVTTAWDGARETFWKVCVDGASTQELFVTMDEALVRFVDVRRSGLQSRAHEYAMRVLAPVPRGPVA